jgi:Tol biopolymer transport system component
MTVAVSRAAGTDAHDCAAAHDDARGALRHTPDSALGRGTTRAAAGMTLRRRRTASRPLAAALALAAIVGVAAASATAIPVRTLRVHPNADGPSFNPVLSASGRVVAFHSEATNLGPADRNGKVLDIYSVDRTNGFVRLVSRGLGNTPADGPSFDPAITRFGGGIAFASSATNLVSQDTNGVVDIFARGIDRPAARVSIGSGGVQANGPSGNPDISRDGRYVVFESRASNLVPGDTNGKPDIFVRDLFAGTTTLVSVARGGGPANGTSGSAAISSNGRVVSFSSHASNLVRRDRNGITDVFVRVIPEGRTELVSVSSRGRQQNRSVRKGFTQISDVSGDGRYVAFDSDASTLVRGDRNRRTDVFVRDRRRDLTTLESENNRGFQGNNDSFAPVITPNGRFVAFESLATNLFPNDQPGEDIFVRDRRLDATTTVKVAGNGAPRGPEADSQLLQRPSISSSATVAAFASTARNLIVGDTNGIQDIFVRLMDPPRGSVSERRRLESGRSEVTFSADDPQARMFVCRVDDRIPFNCPAGPLQLPRGQTLRARAGGPGMLYDPTPLRIRLSRDRTDPRVRIAPLPRSGGIREVRGSASDSGSGVDRVEVAFLYVLRGRNLCHAFDGTNFFETSCQSRPFVRAEGRRRWRLRLPRRVSGFVGVFVRAVDEAGNRSPVRRRVGLVRR